MARRVYAGGVEVLSSTSKQTGERRRHLREYTTASAVQMLHTDKRLGRAAHISPAAKRVTVMPRRQT